MPRPKNKLKAHRKHSSKMTRPIKLKDDRKKKSDKRSDALKNYTDTQLTKANKEL